MKRWLLALAIIALACSSEGARRRGLRAKFNVGLRPGHNFFWDVPRTVLTALAAGWNVLEGKANIPNAEDFSMYCAPDRVLCAFYDTSDRIAGLQIAIDQSRFSKAEFNWDVLGYKEWKPPVSFGQRQITYWVTQMFFIPDGSVRKNAVAPLLDDDNVITNDAIWVTGVNGEFMKIPVDEAEIRKTAFTQQACIPWMGRHYYYAMNKDTPCTSRDIFSWFPLVDSEKLEGVGFMLIGTLNVDNYQRDWFEHPGETAVRAIVNNGPECLYNLAKNNGVTTMHIYFTDQPWYIGCPLW